MSASSIVTSHFDLVRALGIIVAYAEENVATTVVRQREDGAKPDRRIPEMEGFVALGLIGLTGGEPTEASWISHEHSTEDGVAE